MGKSPHITDSRHTSAACGRGPHWTMALAVVYPLNGREAVAVQ